MLIVDDSEINRAIIAELFESKYTITHAASGDEAISILSTGKQFNIIFLDIVMPGRSGLDVLQYMDYEGLIKKMPVIMMTGDATEDNMDKAFAYGVADIIPKPFDGKVLIRRTDNIVDLYNIRHFLEKKVIELQNELLERKEIYERRLDTLSRKCDELENALHEIEKI